MTLAVNISGHESLCGYNAIASSILIQTKDKRDACLEKLSITQDDVIGYINKIEFAQLSTEDKDKIQLLVQSDDFHNKLKELFNQSPLEYLGENFSFTLNNGTYTANISNYCTSTSVKLLGALIRFKLEDDPVFKNSVLESGIQEIRLAYFKEEDVNLDLTEWIDKYDNINENDLMLLLNFFHNLNDSEKEKIFIRNPTLEIIQSHEKNDLANEGGFAVIFDAPALPAQVEGDDGVWQVLNRHTGHYNILFSTEIYDKREAEVKKAKEEAGAYKNIPEYLFENLKNLSGSVLKLIIELCNAPKTTEANLRKVNKDFGKVIKIIFPPSASPKNNQGGSLGRSLYGK